MRKMLIFQIVLAILLLALALLYFFQNQQASFPFTKVYLSNTTVIGRLLGVG